MRAAILAAVILAAAVPATVAAGDPPTLGGTLGATATELIVESAATVPVRVYLVVPEGWEIGESAFSLDPGERHVVPIVKSGPDGQVVATMRALEVAGGTDRSTLVLALGLMERPTVPPFLFAILLLLAAGVIVLGIRKVRHHAPPSR